MSVLVHHTTEGDSAKGAASWMRSQGTMSHRVFNPSNGERIDLLPATASARSLRNLSGGVETNRRGGVYQLEIVGRAVAVPGYGDHWYKALAGEVDSICSQVGIPKVFPCAFVPYPESYGIKAKQRLSGPQWLRVEGIIGHQHVPENDHGDPGALDVERLRRFMGAGSPTGGDVDMSDTVRLAAGVAMIFDAYLYYRRPFEDGSTHGPTTPEPAAETYWRAQVDRAVAADTGKTATPHLDRVIAELRQLLLTERDKIASQRGTR